MPNLKRQMQMHLRITREIERKKIVANNSQKKTKIYIFLTSALHFLRFAFYA